MCGFDLDFFQKCKSKSISGGFIHQAGIFGVKCFSIFCGLILANSKSGEILMPNPMESISLNSFVLLEHLAILLTSTLAINC